MSGAEIHTETTRGLEEPLIVIRPVKPLLDLAELWRFRELVYFLVWRDIKVRYKQTVIGIGWTLLQPLAMMVVFTLFLGRLAEIPSEGIPYSLFAYVALMPWLLFSRTISESAASLVTDQRLITRVYFPRILVPLATILASAFDFVLSLGLLFVLMFFYGFAPSLTVVWLPVFVLLMLVTAAGVGFWLSALNAEYRDVMYILPFLSQFWLFLTPVVYPSSLVPSQWRIIYGLNPMVGVIEGFRWALLGVGEGPSPMLFVSSAVSGVVFLTGYWWFSSREATLADTLGSGGR